jgi:ArsR family transcriptional regulator, arsenate/arsenite/antimonite-responsive transcriptional repressor
LLRHIYLECLFVYLLLMDTKLLEQMESFFKACSDQTRLRILNLLSVEGEVGVCFLVDVLGTNQPKISRHLAYLKKMGLVEVRKDGLRVNYRLASQLSEPGQRILECLAACFSGIEELSMDVQKLRLIRNEISLAENHEIKLEFSREEVLTRSEQLKIELL